MEKTNPHIYHIHIDFHSPCELFERYAIDQLGFYAAHFDGHPPEAAHFEPEKQLTLKTDSKEKFKEIWNKIETKIHDFVDFKGYIEGEYIPLDEYIPYKEYTNIPIPFKIKRRKLNPAKGEDFRQTEIHLTIERDKSHPDLINKLLDSGFYGGYIPKKDGVFLVFTAQGFAKEIDPLIESLTKYLEKAGGASRATIKEEKAIAHILCNITVEDLPEIAGKVDYN